MFRQSEGSTVGVGVVRIVGSISHVRPISSADHLSAYLDHRFGRFKWSHLDDGSFGLKCDLRKFPRQHMRRSMAIRAAWIRQLMPSFRFRSRRRARHLGVSLPVATKSFEIVNASLGVAPDGSDSPKGARSTQSNVGFAAGEELKATEDSSSGPTCSNLDPPGETMILGSDSLTSGQKAVLKGYFVLKHWAEPAYRTVTPRGFPTFGFSSPTVGPADWK